MSFQTREMNGSSSHETTIRSSQAHPALSMNPANNNVFYPPLDMSFPTPQFPPALRKNSVRMTSTSAVPSVNFQVSDPKDLEQLFTKHNLSDFHTGLVNHTEAINILADTIHKTHANFQDISTQMKNGDGFMHDVFENHTGVLNHLVTDSTTVNAALENHQDNIKQIHEFTNSQQQELIENRNTIRRQTNELNALRSKLDSNHGMFHEGLANHTDVLRSNVVDLSTMRTKLGIYSTKVDGHEASIANTAGTVRELEKAALIQNGKINNHAHDIGNVTNTVNQLHLGMVHHTEMLSSQLSITNAHEKRMGDLRDSQTQLASRLGTLEDQYESGGNQMTQREWHGQIMDIKKAVNANAALLNELLSQPQADQTRAGSRENTEHVSMNHMLSSAPRR